MTSFVSADTISAPFLAMGLPHIIYSTPQGAWARASRVTRDRSRSIIGPNGPLSVSRRRRGATKSQQRIMPPPSGAATGLPAHCSCDPLFPWRGKRRRFFVDLHLSFCFRFETPRPSINLFNRSPSGRWIGFIALYDLHSDLVPDFQLRHFPIDVVTIVHSTRVKENL